MIYQRKKRKSPVNWGAVATVIQLARIFIGLFS